MTTTNRFRSLLGTALVLTLTVCIVAAGPLAQAEEKPAGKAACCCKVELLIELPRSCNTPDGMCLLPDGNILLSVPNVNDQTAPGRIMKITPDNKLEEFYDPPKHPDTGKAYPFGICVDPDSGDVYYADLQWFAELKPNWKSRVIRIPMKDGKPGKAEVVVEGMIVANAVVVRDGCLYVSDTIMVPDSKPLVTGIYKIKLSQKRPVQLKRPLEDDPHCIATMLTHNDKVPFGADGLCFDCDGNLYCGNFADGTVHKIEFNKKGKATTPRPAPIWAKADFMKSADGLFYDKVKKEIYVADSLANAIQIVSLDGKVRTLSQEPTFDGADGRMDQPCEALLRGREVIISNFDMPVEGGVNTEFEVPNCISVIRLKK